MPDFNAILKKYWGYDSFRPLQKEVIESVYNGYDTLALMPTGGGKSITFQVAALAKEGICIVVTPLISLMKDQVDNLRRHKIMAQAIHSGLTSREIDIILDNCVYGDYKFLYVSPERIDTAIFKARFAKMPVSLIAVDEAHCISQWGYDFRPAYLNIATLRPLAPNAPILAVTATATPEVANDIMKRLEFAAPNLKKMSFARPNLSYLIRKVEDKNGQLLKIIRGIPGTGIVYCRTRKECETVSEMLVRNNIAADFYHGGLSYPLRAAKQDAWLKGSLQVIVATNAFGMGIDKHEVRYVVHYEMPETLEAYYQEAGRAGRDGKPAFAVLLNSAGDRLTANKRVSDEFPPIETIKNIYNLLYNYLQIGIGEGKTTAHDFNLYDFCSKFRIFSVTVLNTIKILQLNGYMTLTEEIDNPTRIMFTVSREELYRIQINHEELENFIRILLRLYTGLFSEFVAIDEEYIAHLSGYTTEYIGNAFKRLGQLRVISYIPRKQSPLLILNEERLTPDNLRISPDSYANRKKNAFHRLESVFEYIERTDKCRSLILQNYFGEKTDFPCGLCDVCRNDKQQNTNDKRQEAKRFIISVLQKKDTDIKELSAIIKGDSDIVKAELRELIASGTVIQHKDGTLSLSSKNVTN